MTTPCRRVFAWCAGVMFLVALIGCGEKPVATQGVLTVDGKPLAGAIVMFSPDEAAGKSATGTTDAAGKFRLTTATLNDGALPGSYKVTVTHSEPIKVPPEIKDPDEQKTFLASQPQKPSIIPEKYTLPDQTPLKHRVPQDGDAKLDIVSAKQ